MAASIWHMNRLGLVDFWCYDNDEFHFQDGHMLLRGSNGSGKSVTMQSFIPLLLDGNRSSERLDPFGTRSRKMDTYLIDENSDRDERIGYLYLELKRENSEIYKTIGMGMRARRNKPLEVWYFIIEDNRRVNRDFSLIENHLTLSEKQLKNVLGEHQVFRGQNEYMRRVNEALFGFENLDDYKDAIDLLLQLRSPKLSNSLSPKTINETLASSLQPLSEEDLRPMSEAITSMDNLQDELENLKNSYQAAQKISQAYSTYNKALLVDKWNKYQQVHDEYIRIEKEIHDKEKNLEFLKNEYNDLQGKVTKNRIRLEVIQKEKSILMDSDIEKLYEDMVELQKRIEVLTKDIEQKEQQCEAKEEKIVDLKNQIENYENKIYESQKQLKQAFQLLDEIYETFLFDEHSALKESLDNLQAFDFEYTKKRLKEENQKTLDVKDDYQQYETIINQIKQIEDNIISCDHELTQINEKLQNQMQSYQDLVNEYQEYFYKYNEDNKVLKLSNEDLEEMTNLLSDYEYTQDYHSLEMIVHHKYRELSDLLSKEKGLLVLDKIKEEQEYDKIDCEYQTWLNQKDYEPQRDDYVIKHRHYLNNNNVHYIPFYQLLNFDESVDETSQNKIEELLSQMHILDAIVIEKSHRDMIEHQGQGHDYYLWTNHSFNDLAPVSITLPFDHHQLNQIFNQLGIETNNDFKILDYYFKSGVLEGSIDQNQVSCFIGYQRRQLLRQQKIHELKSQLDTLSLKIQDIENKINEKEANLSLLQKEDSLFQKETALKECFELVERYRKEYAFVDERVQQLFNQKNQEEQKSQQIKFEIKNKCQALLLDENKEAIHVRLQDIEEYGDALDHLKAAYLHTKSSQDLLNIVTDQNAELTEDVDQLKYEISSFSSQKEVHIGKVNSIQKELDAKGYTDKQKKLELLQEELNTLEVTIRTQEIKMTQLDTKESFEKQNIDVIKESLNVQKIQRDIYYDLLMQEVHYGFVLKDDSMKVLKQELSQVRLNKSISDYLSSLQSVFFEQASYLSQYHLTHEMDELVHGEMNVDKHFIIKATHQGKKIPFFDLLNILEERIESQGLLIQEEDRHIFEEILVNTIGKKIRNRIYSSKRWVEKMDRYMHDMNTSSGLQLSVKWRAKKALDDAELDTQKLVELLEKDYRLLKESDRQKISQHFRSKIESARRMSLDENITSSFHQLIKEVMDYRQWFEFTLYANKPNEARKELTNRIFYAYSGGEKAIAMYVPLFSAVAAKMESAREDAPRVIALDEAFAGVDENNIDNMFALITKFNFDYIMNSQVLWGDYPSCKSLAIYELFRPNNAPYVTRVAYSWNGHVRKVMI